MNFSVLISIYSKENPEYLYQALNSCILQTLKPTEIVLIKDGPITNELQATIDDFEKKNRGLLNVISLKKNQGLGVALNKGLLSCKYEIVARMDGDDICEKNRFEKEIDIFSNNKDIDVVGSWISEFEENPNEARVIRDLPENSKDIVNFSKKRNPINHMTVMFKKSKVLAVGNYQTFHGFEDYYLWVRMLNSSMKFYNIQESLIRARGGLNQMGRRKGLHYLQNEIRLHWAFYKEMKYISFWRFLNNLLSRVIVRLLPSSFLKYFYFKFLRTKI